MILPTKIFRLKIIFAEGMAVKENPFFAEIPVHQNKGHHLEVQLSVPLKKVLPLKRSILFFH